MSKPLDTPSTCGAGTAVEARSSRVRAVRVGGRHTRRGRTAGYWVARCGCGWRGPGRPARWEAVLDARAHREGWSPDA